MHFFDGERPPAPPTPGWFSAGAGFDINVRHRQIRFYYMIIDIISVIVDKPLPPNNGLRIPAFLHASS